MMRGLIWWGAYVCGFAMLCMGLLGTGLAITLMTLGGDLTVATQGWTMASYCAVLVGWFAIDMLSIAGEPTE